MSDHRAFIKGIFEALALTWESGCKTNITGWDWGCWVYRRWLLMGSLDSSYYCNICLGDSRQIVSQTDSHHRAGWLLSRGCVNYPLGSEPASPCAPRPYIGHLLHLNPLTIPVSPSITLFIFLSRLLFFPLFFFFFSSFLSDPCSSSVPHRFQVRASTPFLSTGGSRVLFKPTCLGSISITRLYFFFLCVCVWTQASSISCLFPLA